MLAVGIYSQNAKEIISLYMHDAKTIDKLIGKNLKRLRQQVGLTQDALGEKIGVDGVVIAQLEGAIRGVGKKVMARLCNALQVEPFEFYINSHTPIVSTDLEKEILYTTRKAEEMGCGYIAEEQAHLVEYRLGVVKTQEGKGVGKGKTPRHKTGSG